LPGNHDVSLDPKWWQTNLDEDDDDPTEPSKALELFRAENTNGLHFLEEGTHIFTLSGNRTFTIYASPYTPEFNGYAFAYGPDENRFGLSAKESIPADVDIIMTHGPPLLPSSVYELDINREGQHCGCLMLYAAVREAKPKVHCFGHIHEGYGVQDVLWSSGTDGKDDSGADEMVRAVCKNSEETVLAGAVGHTLLVNAAIMNHGEEENNRPWLVNLDLRRTE